MVQVDLIIFLFFCLYFLSFVCSVFGIVCMIFLQICFIEINVLLPKNYLIYHFAHWRNRLKCLNSLYVKDRKQSNNITSSNLLSSYL